MSNPPKGINVARTNESIQLLKQHFNEGDIASLVSVLEAITKNPQDDALMEQLSEVFNGLDIMQGAVLTYAPYIALILSDDPIINPD